MNGDVRKEFIMTVKMTVEQKEIFDMGAKWSFDLIAAHIKTNWDKECKTVEEIRDFIFDIWSFIEGFVYGVHYQEMEEYYKKNNISEDDQAYFEYGVSLHNFYVKFCMNEHENWWTTAVPDVKKYFSGEVSFIPNKIYKNFEDYVER